MRTTQPRRRDDHDADGGDDADKYHFIVSSPLPLIAFSLPDRRVHTANQAAGDLLGLTVAELLQRDLDDLLAPAEPILTSAALGVLDSSAVESYRAHRTFVGAHGPVEAAVLVRVVPHGSGALAVMLVMTDDHQELQLSTRALMGSLAQDLATGTLDASGKILSISRLNRSVFQGKRERSSGNYSLISQVHPDDQSQVWAGLKQVLRDHLDVVLSFRLRHSRVGWLASQCHLLATGDDDGGAPIGFMLVEATARPPTAGRIAQLEHHLARISAEANLAGFTPKSSSTSADCAPADLSGLTPRQRDIVNRLLDGARVATIASALFVSRSTIRNHLASVYRALGVHSQAELIERLRPTG